MCSLNEKNMLMQNHRCGEKKNSIIQKNYAQIINKKISSKCFLIGWEIANNFLKGSFSLDF